MKLVWVFVFHNEIADAYLHSREWTDLEASASPMNEMFVIIFTEGNKKFVMTAFTVGN